MTAYKNLFKRDEVVEVQNGELVKKFGLPPFSIFDARSGDWQARKAYWLSLGIKSELGRGENLLKMSDTILEPDPKKRVASGRLTYAMGKERTDDTSHKILAGGRKATATVYGSGGPGQLNRELKSRAQGAEVGFQGTSNMRGKPDNPEMRIPNWYTKLKKGMSKEQIIAEWMAQQTGQNKDLRGPSLSIRTTMDPYRATNKAAKAINTQSWVQQKQEEGLIGSGLAANQSGTSIFDPVLCEMFYRWFVPPRGMILDPFAGGSVRGIVASRLEYQYTGFDLRQEQVDANRAQALELCRPSRTAWICDDSRNVLKHMKPNTADALFSCPPYADLERYSDDPRDLSTLKYDEFLPAYEQIITDCTKVLKPNRFAGFVVGEVRDKDGNCYGFVPDTIRAFEKAGLKLYNDAILITAVGSLSIRVERQFTISRKLGRCHQYVLIFCKGSSREASTAIGGTSGK